ncbi:MAG TPA: hypothetical protein VEX11_19830 [Acetobacteraceae bacterium]|nr:hypothetical protein [Acetobacteraceae bacterium]
MLREAWALARDTVEGFIADKAMTRGAAIACYSMFSIAPLRVVAIAIAGLAFGEEAVRSAVAEQLRALPGRSRGRRSGAGDGARRRRRPTGHPSKTGCKMASILERTIVVKGGDLSRSLEISGSGIAAFTSCSSRSNHNPSLAKKGYTMLHFCFCTQNP